MIHNKSEKDLGKEVLGKTKTNEGNAEAPSKIFSAGSNGKNRNKNPTKNEGLSGKENGQVRKDRINKKSSAHNLLDSSKNSAKRRENQR